MPKYIYSGSIKFVPNSHFNIFHHCGFAYNQDSGNLEYNSNPYGETKFVEINDFTITESGFSFQKKGNKRLTKYNDETPLEKQLTKELHYLIDNFYFMKDFYYTGIDGLWSSKELLFFRFTSWEHGYSSDSLSFKRSGDKLYTGVTPLYDKIEVYNIDFALDRIDLETSKGEIHYEYKLNPHLHNFVKFFFMEGYSEFMKK